MQIVCLKTCKALVYLLTTLYFRRCQCLARVRFIKIKKPQTLALHAINYFRLIQHWIFHKIVIRSCAAGKSIRTSRLGDNASDLNDVVVTLALGVKVYTLHLVKRFRLQCQLTCDFDERAVFSSKPSRSTAIVKYV